MLFNFMPWPVKLGKARRSRGSPSDDIDAKARPSGGMDVDAVGDDVNGTAGKGSSVYEV
jgi:hypothetical protein